MGIRNLEIAGFQLLAIGTVALLFVTTIPATSAETDVSTTTDTNRIKCYTCGQDDDPENDMPGSYCDIDKDDKCPAGSKMYNHTCDIMDRILETDKAKYEDHWIRECPEGVKSCYYAQGRYESQSPIFRGCAGAKYPHDEKCDRELQAVQVVAGKKSVDVEVLLCYCNSDICNQKEGGAGTAKALGVFLLTATSIALRMIVA